MIQSYLPIFIMTITALYFLCSVTWEAKGLNRVFKCYFVLMMIFGAILVSANLQLTVNDYEMARLANKATIITFLAITALQSGWFGYIWKRNNWANTSVKTLLFVITIISTLFIFTVLNIIKFH